MIREYSVDSVLNRLSRTFGPRLIVRPPAVGQEIGSLEHLVGALPRDFLFFLLTCDGLRIELDAANHGAEWHLWHIREMKSAILNPLGPCMPPSVIPFRGDPTASHDCLVAGQGPASGAVMRWDPWGQDFELLSSSFGNYLDRWATYLIQEFQVPVKNGRLPSHLAFDAEFIGAQDLELASLLSQRSVDEWLSQMTHLVGSGEDFE